MGFAFGLLHSSIAPVGGLAPPAATSADARGSARDSAAVLHRILSSISFKLLARHCHHAHLFLLGAPLILASLYVGMYVVYSSTRLEAHSGILCLTSLWS